METVNIHEAKTHFSKLVDAATRGDIIVIAKAGRPVAKLSRLDASVIPLRRVGFLAGEASVPNDFDEWATDEVTALFDGA